jgi:hypothetical protein
MRYPRQLLGHGAQVAVIKKPANHVRRDLLGAEPLKLLPGRELKPPDRRQPVKPSDERGEGRGIRSHHAGNAAVGIAIWQPEYFGGG